MTQILWNIAEYSSIAVTFIAVVWAGLKLVYGIIDMVRGR